MAAFGSLSRGKRREAATYWHEAFDRSLSFAPTDPRVATAHNNEGLSPLLDGDIQANLERFTEAEKQCIAATKWVEQMEVPIAGRGSIFQYLLAAQHSDAFADIYRRHYLSLHAAGAAITNFNTRVTRCRLSTKRDDPSAFDDAIEKLEKVFGRDLPEIKVIRDKKSEEIGLDPIDAPTWARRGNRGNVRSFNTGETHRKLRRLGVDASSCRSI